VPRQVIIEGEMARIVNVEPIREVRVDDLFASVETRPAITLGILPKTAVILHWDESNARTKTARFLTEVPAGMKNLRYGNRRYDLSVPWTYFLHEFVTEGQPMGARTTWQMHHTRVFWAREQVTNYDSQLYTALIANCDAEGIICYGNTGVPVTLPLGVRVDRLTTEFYRTTFMHDSGTGSPWQSETGSSTWRRWEQESATDSGAWRNMPEWNGNAGRGEGRMRHFPVREIIGSHIERPAVVQLEGAIPEIPVPFTFGRAEEWLQLPDITPAHRHRLLVALQNLQAENPGIVETPPARRGRAGAVDDGLGGQPLLPGDDPI
jgi:hypothetical protein